MVFLLPIFDITQLLQFKNLSLSTKMKSLLKEFGIQKCTDFQKKMCPILNDSTKNVSEITMLRRTINASIEKTASKKEFRNRTFYIKSIENLKLKKEHIAMDCFHPSQSAHRLLAYKIFPIIRTK